MQKSVNNRLLIFLFFSLSISISAQESRFKLDIEYINVQLSQAQTDPFKRPFIYRDETSLIKKINPVGLVFGGTLYIYQNVLSKHISADCLFTPSCSEFSKQAVKEDGLIKGTLLTIDRVNRCNRIAAQDLKHYSIDQKTRRYPDPVSRHIKASKHNGE
ncbi:MAG: membrane protein insertion efficiency factor YidD [Bacteroidales bacterium]|nr:membrane protein insertion efficiency factor YidD [Bacteroidales bacterium]MDP3003463.1 membrane protein insertion efficiency factor YidD [Bacteroidales bacterium]